MSRFVSSNHTLITPHSDSRAVSSFPFSTPRRTATTAAGAAVVEEGGATTTTEIDVVGTEGIKGRSIITIERIEEEGEEEEEGGIRLQPRSTVAATAAAAAAVGTEGVTSSNNTNTSISTSTKINHASKSSGSRPLLRVGKGREGRVSLRLLLLLLLGRQRGCPRRRRGWKEQELRVRKGLTRRASTQERRMGRRGVGTGRRSGKLREGEGEGKEAGEEEEEGEGNECRDKKETKKC